MMDISTVTTAAGMDWALKGHELKTDTGLATAVLISLFTDARADDSEQPGDGFARRGWWGSELVLGKGQQLGSKLWLLPRITDKRLLVTKAREWTLDALSWMMASNVVSAIDVNAELQGRLLALEIILSRPSAAPLTQRFNLTWGV